MTLVVAALFWTRQWQRRDSLVLPNPDIFQYINEGNQYLQFRLPDSIHPPPVAPILYSVITKFLPSYITYPELKSAQLINITLAALSLVTIYLLAGSLLSPFLAFALVLLLATNQIFLFYSLDVTNEIISLFFLTLSLLYYHYRKTPLVYLSFGLLFLIRYENIVVPLSILIFEYFNHRKIFKWKNIIYSFLPVVFWLLILNFHSTGSSLADNAYLVEIANGLKNIPNLAVFHSLLEIITFENSPVGNTHYLFALILLGLFFFQITRASSNRINIIYLILGFSLLFLYLFPNFSVRYFIPFLWIVYLIITNHRSRLISFTVVLCLLIYNFARLNYPSNYVRPNEGLEYRLAANWINRSAFDKPIIVLIYEPQILDYFITHPKVSAPYIFPSQFSECKEKIECVAANISKKNPEVDVLIISTRLAQNDINYASDQFTVTEHHVSSFDFDTLTKISSLQHTYVEGDLFAWFHVFKYKGK